jgi:quercetin dioxygenase-like cupin family protein
MAGRPPGGWRIVPPDPGRSLPWPTKCDAAAASLPVMAYTGQIIHNPVSGERITFLQTSRDTAGEMLEIELELSPDGHVPGAHVHPEQEERFHVLEGEMKFRLGMRTIVAGPGDSVVVPAGRVHCFANNGDSAARARDRPRAHGAARRPGPSARPRRALRGAGCRGHHVPGDPRDRGGRRRGLACRAGAARGWCPIRSSKPAGRGSPRSVGSIPAPLRFSCWPDGDVSVPTSLDDWTSC